MGLYMVVVLVVGGIGKEIEDEGWEVWVEWGERLWMGLRAGDFGDG